MAWSVDNIYKFTLFLMRKNQAGGVSATDLFYAWNQEQAAYMSDLLGRFQKNSNGKDVQNTGLIQNETILTKLAPFTKVATIAITSGNAAKPADFALILDVRKDGHKVFPINKDEIWIVNDDVIDPPSVADDTYYRTEYGSNIAILPSTTTGNITLDYIATPTDVVWGYTLDGNNRQVYSAGTSVQPLWNTLDTIEITKRALKAFGVSFKDSDFAQYGNSVINSGD